METKCYVLDSQMKRSSLLNIGLITLHYHKEKGGGATSRLVYNKKLALMMRFYSKMALTALLFTLLCTSVRAQTTITSQGFEGSDTWSFTAFPTTYNISSDVWAATDDVGTINDPSEGTLFWGMRDLENSNSGLNPADTEHTLTFADTDLTGETLVKLSFDYNAVAFNVAGEILEYQLFYGGSGQGRVNLVDGGTTTTTNGWATEVVDVPDGTSSVSITFYATFNGGDQYAGFDNLVLSRDNAVDPCGITSFGSAATECTSSTDGEDNDTYEISIPFTGSDADASLVVEVGGSAVAFTLTAGDLATGTSPLIIQSPAFLEGTSFSISLTDGGGDCVTVSPVTGSVTSNECNPSCSVSILTENVTFLCESLTGNTDNTTIDIDYTGSDDGVNVTVTGDVNGVVFSGTDLFTTPDGRVMATGIPEGDTYTVLVSGSGCDRTFILSIFDGVCATSDIVINEVLYDGITSTEQTSLGIPAFGDPNLDNTFNGGEDEFVEITNVGSGNIDIGGYTLSDQNNADIVTVPSGTILSPGGYFVFFGGGTPNLPCQTVTRASQTLDRDFLGLNNSSEEQVIIKDGNGVVVAQMSYTGLGSSTNESLALSPNADPAGSYIAQTSILSATRYSPCFDNDEATLPVELLAFTADPYAKYVVLNWETTNEVANDRFVVERSVNGRVWERIGTVMASGLDAGRYEFRDENPVAGQNIYRLRQYDLNGLFALYGPVVAELSAEAGIYPNPVKGELYLRGFNADTHVSLLDASGKLLQELPAGANEVNVASLVPGMYMLRISGNKNAEVLRFIKQ